MRHFLSLSAVLLLLSTVSPAQCPPTNPALTLNFQWSTAVGTGNELLRPGVHGTVTGVYPVNGYTVTVNVKDPNNRLTINNYQADPLISANGPFTNVYSETNGVWPFSPGLYDGYYRLGMFAANGAEKVDLEYNFNTPVYLCNLEVSDIDYDASCAGFCSYEDEVDVTAFNGSTPIPVTITKAAAFTEVTITGQNIVANWFAGADGDVAASSNLGKVFLSSTQPITRLVISYSNGPDDDGTSNDQHIRVGNVLAASVSILPVTIRSFDATYQAGKVTAALQVTNEQQIIRYELQRATDGRSFSAVQELAASGAPVYNFTDNNPLTGEQFYRVKIAERNGTVLYSPIAKVTVPVKKEYSIGHVTDAATLIVSSTEVKQIGISLYNSTGKLMNTQQARTNGYSIIPIETKTLASGVYFISVTENGTRVFSGRYVK
jgi:hypothetical protein